MKELEITIDREGKISIHVKGVKGSNCTDLTKSIERELGEVQDKTFTEEYYEEPRNTSSEEELLDQ